MTNETSSTMQQWHTFMRPILEALSDGRVHPKRELKAAVATLAGLSAERQVEQLDSGSLRSLNRIGWATFALRWAKALASPSRGPFVITDDGHTLLAKHRESISVADLEQIRAFPEYVPSRKVSTTSVPATSAVVLDDQTPQDLIQSDLDAIEDDVKSKLLERLRGTDPLFFEQVVRSLLAKMGHGTVGEFSRLPESA